MKYIKVIITCLLASLVVIALYFGTAPVTAYLLNVPVLTSPVNTTTPTVSSSTSTSINLSTVQSGSFFDFDNGTETNDVDKADIWWGQLPNGERYLAAKNNAMFNITGNNFTGKPDSCPDDPGSYSSAKINGSIDNNLAGTVICIRTNRTYKDTHYTEFEINSSRVDLTIRWILTRFGEPAEQPFTFIKINSIPSGAEIWLDGNDKGKMTPDRIYFEEDQLGKHTYELSLSGYQNYNDVLNVSASADNTITVNLIPTSTPTASIYTTPTPVTSNAVASTSKPSTVPGFLALPLLIAIFLIYFLYFKNRR